MDPLPADPKQLRNLAEALATVELVEDELVAVGRHEAGVDVGGDIGEELGCAQEPTAQKVATRDLFPSPLFVDRHARTSPEYWLPISGPPLPGHGARSTCPVDLRKSRRPATSCQWAHLRYRVPGSPPKSGAYGLRESQVRTLASPGG